MNILLTGGAGFIGSHTAIELLASGHRVVIVDNFCNSAKGVIGRIEQISGSRVRCYEADVRDGEELDRIFKFETIDCVIHFAGLKAVGESYDRPLEYYDNNINSTITLLRSMLKNGVGKIIFSSSATVYGEDNPYPYVETMKRGECSSPYGWTKYMAEQIMMDTANAMADFSVLFLRYFNPIGAHPSGEIGEDPKGIPNNLMPYITQVAVGKRDRLTIFGNDYNTPDGTCRRDYLHVVDLAKGHVKAAEYIGEHRGTEVFNLGTGQPYSVLDIVNTFIEVTGSNVPFVFGNRRKGDLPEFWADATRACEVLGWEAKLTLEDMCRDSFRWQMKNPEGIF